MKGIFWKKPLNDVCLIMLRLFVLILVPLVSGFHYNKGQYLLDRFGIYGSQPLRICSTSERERE